MWNDDERDNLRAKHRRERMWMILTTVVVFIGCGAFTYFVTGKRDAELAERLSNCTYVGTRIERVRTVYQWDCNGLHEETLRKPE